MESLEPLVAAHPVFKSLDPSHTKLIVGCASNAVFEQDDFVFREGEEANVFYLIRQGHVVIETYSPEKGTIGIQTCRDGDVVGWSWLIPPYRWRFDARALQRTRLIAIDGKCLRTKCDQDHNLGYQMMRIFTEVISERLDATRMQLLDFYAR